MFKNFKKFMGFTLAELLIVFAIIGIISTITLMTTKRLSASDKFAYQRVYDSLLTAAYNAVAEVDSQGIDTPEKLCIGLAKYINSQGATKPKEDDDKFKGSPDVGYCNTGITTRVTKDTIDFNEKDDEGNEKVIPDFIANNGMRFFITEKLTQEGLTDYAGDTQDGGIKFYIVFVDLNGTAGQNRIDAGDVVAFAVTENADVVPLGHPAFDAKHYLGVRVVFPENSDHPDEYYSDSMSYYEAIHTAWGDLHNFDDLRTFDFNNVGDNGFTILQGTPIMATVTDEDRANKPLQHNDCICDTSDNENCAANCSCDKEADPNCDSSCGIDAIDRFECDIKIQRYY